MCGMSSRFHVRETPPTGDISAVDASLTGPRGGATLLSSLPPCLSVCLPPSPLEAGGEREREREGERERKREREGALLAQLRN